MRDLEGSVHVSLPDDEDGFLQRSCPNCDLLFAIHSVDFQSARVINLRCPRCKFVERFDAYATASQMAFATAHATYALYQMAEDAFEDLKRNLFSGLRSSKHVKITGPQGRVSLPGTQVPSSIDDVAMTVEQCQDCGVRFKTSEQRAAACPVCR